MQADYDKNCMNIAWLICIMTQKEILTFFFENVGRASQWGLLGILNIRILFSDYCMQII